MGYPVDIDEISTKQLRAEIDRRERNLAEGKCPYCGRPMTDPVCKMFRMHRGEDR